MLVMMDEKTKEIDIEAFEANYGDAKGYHQRAIQFLQEGHRSSLVFNVASVALERYLVALCDLYGLEPRNHNYISLMKLVETVVDISPDLNKRVKSLDWIFGICSIDDYRHPNPDAADTENVLYMCNEIQKLFDENKISYVMSIKHNRTGE